MGALHDGHLRLIRKAAIQCDRVVCSIFVNPLQFNNAEDLRHYPRQLDQDRQMLEEAGCHALFAPEKASIFADFTPQPYDLGGLDTHWEGPSRPGHFNGVVNVVERLFHYVRPERALFGEKDRQQLAILQFVARAKHWPELIVPCPTVREPSGLALSSRNARLDPVQRDEALVLYKALGAAADHAFRSTVEETRNAALAMIRAAEGIRLDYFAIADQDSLEPLTEWGDRTQALAMVAAHVGPVRLIDNIMLER